MAVPDFQSFFKPLLEIAGDEKEHSIREAREIISKKFELTDEDLQERLPSGTQTTFEIRVAWAKSYFIQAKVFESPRRAYFKITERGKELLKKNHPKINIKILNQFPEFVEFHTSKQKGEDTKQNHEEISKTPEESLQSAYQNIRNELASEILNKVKSNSPFFLKI